MSENWLKECDFIMVIQVRILFPRPRAFLLIYQIRSLVGCLSASILRTPQSITNAKGFCRSDHSDDFFSLAVHYDNHIHRVFDN